MRVERAGVVGAGTMGAAIAELLAYNEIEVVLLDVDDTRVQRGQAKVRSYVDELVRFHAGRADRELGHLRELGVALDATQTATLRAKLAPKLTTDRADAIVARVHGTTDFARLAAVDFVVEAVFEREPVKREVLEQLDRVLPDGTVIGSNTSSLSITRLARGLRHAPTTLVTHFFNPPMTLPLVEVAAGLETRDDVVSETLEFLGGLRNHRYPLAPVRVKEAPAFVVNRLLLPVLNEACFALDEGVASARDIDLAMKAGAGLPMGPFELGDMIGLDVVLEVAETMQRETGDPKYRPAPGLRRRVDAGHLGQKTGRGFYEYI